jgi:hypothetical protein
LLIAFPFVCGGFSGADDPDTIFVVRFGVAVNDDQNHDGTDYANGVPAPFTAFHAIGKNDVERIIPDFPRQLERHSMLDEIRCGLAIVPLEYHSHPYIDINVCTAIVCS